MGFGFPRSHVSPWRVVLLFFLTLYSAVRKGCGCGQRSNWQSATSILMAWSIYERNCALVLLYKKYVIFILGKEQLYIYIYTWLLGIQQLSSILIRKDCIDLSMNCAIWNKKMLGPRWGRSQIYAIQVIKYSIVDFGELKWFLGIHVLRDRTKKWLSQAT